MVKWVSAYALRNINNGEVDVDGSCQFLADSVDWLGLGVGGHPVLSLHSSNELSQWLWSRGDNTVNIVVVIIIICGTDFMWAKETYI